MRARCCFAMFTLVVAAQEKAKPIEQAKAFELLDQAAAVVSSAHLEIQVAALRDLGISYRATNRKKAIELFEQGFQIALGLPDEKANYLRSKNQGAIIEQLTQADSGKALELLTQLSPGAAEGTIKPQAYEKVVQSLLSSDQLDRAVDLLSAYGEGEYPFRALNAVMQKLANNDGRRIILFGQATSAYTATPRGDFGELITRNWETLPRESVQPAVATVISHLMNPSAKSPGKKITRLGSNEGAVTFNSQEELQIFKLLKVVKAVEPKRLDEIFEKHPALREAMDKMPSGFQSGQTVTATSDTNDAAEKAYAENMARDMAQRMDQVERVRRAADKDPREALKLAEKIKDADLRLSALVAVGAAAAAKKDEDPGILATVLTACIVALEKADKPLAVGMGLMQMFEFIEQAKQPDLIRQIADKAITATERALKSDLKKDNPNIAPRDVWPSVQMARSIMFIAGRGGLGTDAANLLERWRDADLRLVAQIALARALLGEMPNEMGMAIARAKP